MRRKFDTALEKAERPSHPNSRAVFLVHSSVYFQGTGIVFAALRYALPLLHSTWFLKRSVYADLGGYREIDACEDYDFLVRAALRGFRFGNLQEPLLRHRINANGISYIKRGSQKMALSFLSAAYRKGRSPSIEDWTAYRNSKAGVEKQRNFDRFYAVAADVKKRRSALYAISKLVPLCVTSPEAREMLWNSFYSRVAKRF